MAAKPSSHAQPPVDLPSEKAKEANFTDGWSRPATLAAFGAALRSRREKLGLTLDRLAEATGISKPYLSNIETARSPGPASEEKLRKLARALQLPAGELLAGADWLRSPISIRRALAAATPGGGDAAPRRKDGAIDLDAAIPESRVSMAASGIEGTLPVRSVPLINRVAAGRASEFTDLSYPAGIADQYVQAPDIPEAPAATAFAVRVRGDSMSPEYVEGEILIVGPGEPRDGDDCVIRLGELEEFATTFKRVYFTTLAGGAAVRLVPVNPAHAPRTILLDQVSGIYPLLYKLTPARRQVVEAAGDAGATRGSFTSSPLSLEND